MAYYDHLTNEPIDYELNNRLVWVVIKILHDGTTHVYAACNKMEQALKLVALLKSNNFVNHALCYQVPYYGPEVSLEETF